MKLFQALKLKNKLVGEIQNKKGLINQKNSVTKGEVQYYNSKTLFEELKQFIRDLNNLKFAINLANSGIQQSIYELAEAKTMLNFVKSLNTNEGKIRNRFSSAEEADEYIVSINELDKNSLVNEYQILVDTLQDKIDVYNHTTTCDIDETQFLINKK